MTIAAPRLRSEYETKFKYMYKTLNAFRKLPAIVGIETFSTCNRACSYCPNSTVERAGSVLSDADFKRVVNDLHKQNYKGEFHLHGYGEPLLDKRLPSLVAYIKSILPKSRVVIATNGDKLTEELKIKLSASGVDCLLITDHTNAGLQTTTTWFGNMKVFFRSFDKLNFTNRVGLLGKMNMEWTRMAVCYSAGNPWIMATGDIAFCCHDYAATKGTGINVKSPDWLEQWQAWPARFERIRAVFGPRPKQCDGCLIIKK